MIIGVDIGGTKTLLSVFAENGKLLNEARFPTNTDYSNFLQELTAQALKLGTNKGKIACAAVPGLLDRKNGIVISLGNLPWQNQPIRQDISKALGINTVLIENDSKLAGLGEFMSLEQKLPRVYYITLSTGIGGTLLINGQISQDVIDGEIGMVRFPHNGALMRWEDFASGRAFYDKYKQKASDVDDPAIWQDFAQNIGLGITMVCCIYQVDTIIFGGGLGIHLEKYNEYLKPYISTYLHSTIKKPRYLIKAHHGDRSVIYGCYHYAKDKIT